MKIEDRIEALERAVFGRSDNCWHEIKTLPKGTIVGERGSMTHIINKYTGKPISKGYHTIKEIEPPYLYEGKTGSMIERFTIIDANIFWME